jgi:hypothetical protein
MGYKDTIQLSTYHRCTGRIATMAKKRFSGVMGLPVDHKTFSPFADNALICPQVGTELFT